MNRGEVWEVNLDPTMGAEIQKIRPCVIVSRDALASIDLRMVVPLTGWREDYASAPWIIPVDRTPANGLSKKSSADTFQVRSVSVKRLIRCLGRLPTERMTAISQGLKLSLALD